LIPGLFEYQAKRLEKMNVKSLALIIEKLEDFASKSFSITLNQGNITSNKPMCFGLVAECVYWIKLTADNIDFRDRQTVLNWAADIPRLTVSLKHKLRWLFFSFPGVDIPDLQLMVTSRHVSTSELIRIV
jgi:hypothetical protein